MTHYYNPEDVIEAAGLMADAAKDFEGNDNFEYDLVDIVRQAIAERGRLLYPAVVNAYKSGDKKLFDMASSKFLNLILLQDELLSVRKEFCVGNWIGMARNIGTTPEEKDRLEWNARVQISTWGNRHAADKGGLRDYAHKEWNGILKDLYYVRWQKYFDYLGKKMEGLDVPEIDFYEIEEGWNTDTKPYDYQHKGNAIDKVIDIFSKI